MNAHHNEFNEQIQQVETLILVSHVFPCCTG